MDRASGWSAILQRLGDPDAGILPTLFIHHRCARLLECLPYLQHDPDRPGDVLKNNLSEEGAGGDDPADALRYLLATPSAKISICKLRGFQGGLDPSENPPEISPKKNPKNACTKVCD